MEAQLPLRVPEAKNYEFFLDLPDPPREAPKRNVKGVQFLEPLFEYSGACSGCGETPYVKLLSQLFGDRAVLANATGCSSIYGGNLPTTPWTINADGRGPAWNNSLFEDAAEFGLGFRLTVDKQIQSASELLEKFRDKVGGELVDAILSADQSDEPAIFAQRERVEKARENLKSLRSTEARSLMSLIDVLVKRSIWSIGGDGWAYDIGYGGLDHVIASGRDINLLVLDTGVYSNTGGQCSKATPLGAVAKFAAGGKDSARKDLGLMAMSYGNVYVAQIAMGSNDQQTVKAFMEAEAFDGPSIIIAYSHCIAQGIDMARGMTAQKLAVDSGSWIMYRYDPRLKAEGKNPLQLDSRPPKVDIGEYMANETRFRMLRKANPAVAAELQEQAQADALARRRYYEQLAAMDFSLPDAGDQPQV
jgi:pyruvate-ferredoxin/flavodoxin oxidoreductase